MPSSDLLAVAFTDLNGNNKYNPGKDTLIAALWDTNNAGVVSVGDTIQWGTYPAIPDGSASGTGGIYTQLFSAQSQLSTRSSIRLSLSQCRRELVQSYGLQPRTWRDSKPLLVVVRLSRA